MLLVVETHAGPETLLRRVEGHGHGVCIRGMCEKVYIWYVYVEGEARSQEMGVEEVCEVLLIRCGNPTGRKSQAGSTG